MGLILKGRRHDWFGFSAILRRQHRGHLRGSRGRAGAMSHKKAREIISRNRIILARARSGDPQYELDEERIAKLMEEIERAEMHLEDEE